MSFGPEKEKSHYQLFPGAELLPLERVSSSTFPIAPDGNYYYELFLHVHVHVHIVYWL